MPNVPRRLRIEALLREMAQILSALQRHITNVNLVLPHPQELRSLSALKPCEDMIDALVCCWMGICVVNGTAVALGDEVLTTSARGICGRSSNH